MFRTMFIGRASLFPSPFFFPNTHKDRHPNLHRYVPPLLPLQKNSTASCWERSHKRETRFKSFGNQNFDFSFVCLHAEKERKLEEQKNSDISVLKHKFDRMYSNIVATGEFAWAPSSRVLARSDVDPGTSNTDIDRDGLEEGSGDFEEDVI
ncbi:hypothetical protein POTOM_045955 [Populus tomentosa]|uniref:Uncharacterized protein n=1 Tax=Populus tomentosa TaxID=118781 RepID=A0A8X8CFM8_POPTO|nr:hypothetical protein POTOM_045955 [Populus tomentosa]